MADTSEPFGEGRCACGAVSYRLHDAPYVVHCCHCTDCQRECGSAFALNAVIETDRVEITAGCPEAVILPSASGRGQEVLRCPACRTAVWSHYGGVGSKAAFIRVGTLDRPAACPPSVHIFTRSKLPWVQIPPGAHQFEAFYPGREIPAIYGEAGAARFRALRGR
ncbi:GFA family protein [Novosphingobium cyanobacteriorum]|uniref:GFA family protein n=1 Tax=Novosphingobium cyanobacteriorum TaxID=3024215 RepID=A0ABT6CJT7_9SPHN|nr:GFA family protein [Novosphingobium cyanobacteriorum]MDF8334175.1 GFA family protein [Novosphingobium cyanobacteriorum]